METNKFTTTIKCSGCVAKATPFLDEAVGTNNWEVDVNDPAKVLTVTGEADKGKIIRALEMAGFRAEAL